jgi:hypothetical protein
MAGELITLKGTISTAPTRDGRHYSVELRTDHGTALIRVGSGNVGTVIAELKLGEPVQLVGILQSDPNDTARRVIAAASIQSQLRIHVGTQRGWAALAAEVYRQRRPGPA